MAESILKQLHGDAHLSKKIMYRMATNDYYIEGIGKKIEKIVDNCVVCILATPKKGTKDGWLNPLEKYDVPLHTFHIDHTGQLETTKKSYQYIFVVIDAFTKFTWLYPTKSTKCEEALDKLRMQQTTFGNPARIVADKGSAFTAKAFEDYCMEENIDLHLVTTATPRGNGQVERMNSVIKSTLKKLAIDEPAKWYQHVDRVQRCINSSVSRSIGTTPFNLMFGVNMKNKEDLKLCEVLEHELMLDFHQNRQNDREEAAKCIAKIQAENSLIKNVNSRASMLLVIWWLFSVSNTKRVQNFGQLSLDRTKSPGYYETTDTRCTKLGLVKDQWTRLCQQTG